MKQLKLIDKSGAVIGNVNSDVMDDPDELRKILKKSSQYTGVKTQYEMILGQANSFASVAADIYHSQLTKNIVSVKPEYIAPFIVNSVFAIELFLKTIHIQNDTKSYAQVSNEHSLKKLYFSLPGKLQQSLIHSLNACLVAEKKEVDTIDLPARFRELANAFVDWRYLHEKKHLKIKSLPDLITIMSSLYNSAIDIQWYLKKI